MAYGARIRIPSREEADAAIARERRCVRSLIEQTGKVSGRPARRAVRQDIDRLRGRVVALEGEVTELRALVHALLARVEGM